ncbi:MAG: twin-arginine translocase TatA/TatE family subunit [Dehalococcoidales bacterium]|nr:twin-arginine translocase TatA/TatE family subunit [Dehalococcoidales bacterium]
MIRPGPLEIGLILVIILIVFGVGKLPQVGAAFGKSIRAFKKGQTGEEEEEEAKAKDKAKKKKTRKKKAVKKVAEEAPATKAEEKIEEKA